MLAASALPVFVGMTIAMLGFHTRAGLLGGAATSLVAGGLTFVRRPACARSRAMGLGSPPDHRSLRRARYRRGL